MTQQQRIEHFTEQLTDHGFKYCSDYPTTYVRIDKDLSTKFFVFIHRSDNGAKIERIIFSLRLETPSNMINADESFLPVLLWNMTCRSNWYETIVDRLCEKIERFYYDTLTKRIDKNERNNNHPSSLQ